MCRCSFRRYSIKQFGRLGLAYRDRKLSCWFSAELPGPGGTWLIEMSRCYDLETNLPVDIDDLEILVAVKTNFEKHFNNSGDLVEFLYNGILFDSYFTDDKSSRL
jgi:hypothetical protein